jgi:hypothetical protein
VAHLEEVVAPDYLAGVEEWSIDRVRFRRDEVTEVEIGLSYLRRIVQGRLDIVLAALHQRSDGDATVDLDDFVERLPEILGDRVHAPGLGRLPTLIGPGELDDEWTKRLEAVFPPSRLDRLEELQDTELTIASAALDGLEKSLSSQRRVVFQVIDRLQEELVRRYRTGEATVDSLLP